MDKIAASVRLALVALMLLIGIPAQWLALKLGSAWAKRVPILFHRLLLRVIGVRVTVKGTPSPQRPLLVVSNHTSWLDISIIGSLMPLSFIAKSEIAGWPVFGLMAKLQRSIFVDRNRRSATKDVTDSIAERLINGDPLVLFGEGTTNDGNHLLPFRSALLGAARDAIAHGDPAAAVMVQPLALVYCRRDGLPCGRADRPDLAWYGDMDLAPHLWAMLRHAVIDVVIVWGEPERVERKTDRKALAARLESAVRAAIVEESTGRKPLPAAAQEVVASSHILGYSQSQADVLNPVS